MTKPVFIYCLWCPRDRKIRYIGQSNQPTKRLYLHLLAASHGRENHTRSLWLRKLLTLGVKPRLRILCKIKDGEDWRERERAIIALALAKKWPLTNETAGGDGVIFVSKEHFERVKILRKNGFTAEVRKKKSETMKRLWTDPEFREKQIARLKENAKSPQRRAELSRASHCRTAEHEAKRLAAVKLYWAKPENRKKQAELTAKANRLKGHL